MILIHPDASVGPGTDFRNLFPQRAGWFLAFCRIRFKRYSDRVRFFADKIWHKHESAVESTAGGAPDGLYSVEFFWKKGLVFVLCQEPDRKYGPYVLNMDRKEDNFARMDTHTKKHEIAITNVGGE